MRMRLRIQARAVVWPVLVALGIGATLVVAPIPTTSGIACAGSGPNRAALVIEHGDLSSLQVCVAFSSPTITGQQLLKLSGIEYMTQPYGAFGEAVCQIDNEPLQFTTCLPPSPKPYWAMFVSRGGGAWATANLGVSVETFANGDAEGFRYDSQSGAALAPPAPRPCPQSTPAPPRPTSAPLPTPRATARPTGTSRVAPSIAPTGVPTAPLVVGTPSSSTPTGASGSPTFPVASGHASASSAPGATAGNGDASSGPSSSSIAAIAVIAVLLLSTAVAARRRRPTALAP